MNGRAIAALAAIAVLAFALIGCGGQVETEKVEPTPQAATPGAPAEEPEAPEAYLPGDSVNAEGVTYTLNEWWIESEGPDEYTQPKEGHVWVYIDMTVENQRNEAANISSLLMIELIDKDGYEQEIDIFAPTKGSLDGEIGAGRKKSGQCAFEVEEGNTEGLELVIKPEVFRKGQIIFRLVPKTE